MRQPADVPNADPNKELWFYADRKLVMFYTRNTELAVPTGLLVTALRRRGLLERRKP